MVLQVQARLPWPRRRQERQEFPSFLVMHPSSVRFMWEWDPKEWDSYLPKLRNQHLPSYTSTKLMLLAIASKPVCSTKELTLRKILRSINSFLRWTASLHSKMYLWLVRQIVFRWSTNHYWGRVVLISKSRSLFLAKKTDSKFSDTIYQARKVLWATNSWEDQCETYKTGREQTSRT